MAGDLLNNLFPPDPELDEADTEVFLNRMWGAYRDTAQLDRLYSVESGARVGPKSLADLVIEHIAGLSEEQEMQKPPLENLVVKIKEQFPQGPAEYEDGETTILVYELRRQFDHKLSDSLLVVSTYDSETGTQHWYLGDYDELSSQNRDPGQQADFMRAINQTDPVNRDNLIWWIAPDFGVNLSA